MNMMDRGREELRLGGETRRKEEAESQKSGVSYSTSGEGDGTPLHLLVSKRGSVLV